METTALVVTTEAAAGSPRDHRARPLLLALAIALWLLLLGFAHTDLTLYRRSAQLVYFLSAFAVFAVAVGVVWRLGHRASRWTVAFILLAGVFFRLTLAPVRPVTTWDVYRYIWEGEVIDAGHNPFLEPPNSPALDFLHDAVWRQVEFQSVPAAYPPVAQYVFALAARLPADKVITLKLVMALFDIGTVLLLPGLLARLRRPPAWALVYAWHPLVVGEVVARGHLDSIGIFFLVLAVRGVEEAKSRGVARPASPAAMAVAVGDLAIGTAGRQWLWYVSAGAALAAAALAKGYALFTVPFFVVAGAMGGDRLQPASRGSSRMGRLTPAPPIWLLSGFAATAVLAYLPFLDARGSLFRGIGLYSRLWHGYAPVYPVVGWIARWFAHDPVAVTRQVLEAAFGVWVLWLLVGLRRAGETVPPLGMTPKDWAAGQPLGTGRSDSSTLRLLDSSLDASFLALAGFFLLSPVLYSWYLAWTVPFLCLHPRPGWLLLTGTIFAFYAHEFAGPHAEYWWLNVIEYGSPLLVGLALWRRQRTLPRLAES